MVHRSQNKKKFPQNKIAILIASAICFNLLVTPIYASYYSLSESDFSSPDLSLESPDQECQSIFTFQPLFILLSLIEISIFCLNESIAWEAPSSDRKFVSLRC